MEPFTLFPSRNQAAINFGDQFNGKSIIQGREYAATIYKKVAADGNTYFAYNEPRKGTNDGATVPTTIPKGGSPEAIIHSHGKFEKGYDNNNFSTKGGDTDYAEAVNLDIYVTTPNGSLKVYDVNSNNQSVVSEDIQSDPKDPTRKNSNAPVESPNRIKANAIIPIDNKPQPKQYSIPIPEYHHGRVLKM